LQFTLFSQSTPSSQFVLSPAIWTPQEIASSNLNPNSISDDNDMSDTSDTFFTGKPEDQDPQDFLNRIERTILMKTGLTEADKVRFFELSIKTKSPADAWLSTLTLLDRASFKTMRMAFELRWPTKPITEKTTAEKQALLDETILKPSDLGRRVAANLGAEEELSHVVWADRVERMANDIPDTNNLLVASTRKKLPKPLLKLVGLKPMTWKQFTDAVRAVSLEELIEKIEEERDATRYAPIVPNTPSKALGAAFQNINLTRQLQQNQTSQYQPQRTQLASHTTFGTYPERPVHERLADVLNKALPIQPNNPEGLVNYNSQVTAWHATYGQNGKGPTETKLYPLSPGTVPVASGECWKCGRKAHHPGPCSFPPVPTLETKWRSIAQTIRKKAEMAATSTANVNLVTEESDEVNTYDTEELAHLHQLINQGKAGGSST
jgi:hypothetical protein